MKPRRSNKDKCLRTPFPDCKGSFAQALSYMKREATPSFHTPSSSAWTPLGRGSDGRFGLRRFRAKRTPTPFGTHRAFTHALPPSFGLRSVPFTVPPCFFPVPLK